MSKHAAYREKQDGIYANIRRAHATVGVTDTLHNDVREPQGAFLVAWRHPESIATPVEEVSLAVSGVTGALVYGRDNLHTTLSDLGLAPNLVINPTNADHAETLDALSKAVKAGLDTAGAKVIGDRGIQFADLATNGKAVIAPGQANDEVLDINEAVKAASRELGINDGEGLKGAWGAHMTVNRFTEDSPLDTAAHVISILETAPRLGLSTPTAIDVGFLAVNQGGFTFTTHERFPLARE